jgi:hypothetical protein
MASPFDMLNTLFRQVKLKWLVEKAESAHADAMQTLDRRSRKIVWAALNSERDWRISRRYWIHRPTGLSFWIAKGRPFFKAFRKPDPNATPVLLPDVALNHLWTAFEIQQRAALAPLGWPADDDGTRLQRRLTADAGDLTLWTVTREQWTHKPTGVSFWIGNGQPHFECLASTDIQSMSLPFTERQMRDLWTAYGGYLAKLLKATGS